MIDIRVRYTGELHCEAEHGPSRSRLGTDAPVDNHGRGETFSPTDLLATALGTCMLTVMGIAAQKRGLELAGMELHVQKHMTQTPPRRVARLPVTVTVPAEVAARVSATDRRELEVIADTCPVRLSLLPAIEIPLQFDWG